MNHSNAVPPINHGLIGIGKPLIALHHVSGFEPPMGAAVAFALQDGEVLLGETVVIEAGGNMKKQRLGFFYLQPGASGPARRLVLDSVVVGWQLRENTRDVTDGTNLLVARPDAHLLMTPPYGIQVAFTVMRPEGPLAYTGETVHVCAAGPQSKHDVAFYVLTSKGPRFFFLEQVASWGRMNDDDNFTPAL